jgi:hypothetical protein
MKNFLKRLMARWYNPWTMRDKNGRIIDDIKRRREIKDTEKRMKEGSISLPDPDPETGRRLIRISNQGKITMHGEERQ